MLGLVVIPILPQMKEEL